MATKRHHNKSRLGCDRCRLRRVKCDEKEPSCSNCINRHEQCLYARRNAFAWVRRADMHVNVDIGPDPPPQSHGQPASSSPTRGDAAISTATTTATASRNATSLRELQLMHHWCAYTSQGFSSEVTDIFRNHVTSEAFRHDYLMDAIFAISALRMAVEAVEAEDTETSRTHMTTALHYQNKCLCGLRDALQNMTQSNCTAVLCSTMALMVSAMVSPLVPAAPDDDCESTVGALLKVVDFINAIVSICEVRGRWVLTGPLATIMSILRKKPPPLKAIFPGRRLHQLNDVLTVDEDKRDLFRSVIKRLENTLEEDDKILAWPAMVEPQFLDELKQENPVAEIIFMHWGALLYHSDGLWWSRYSGRALVQELSGVLGGQSALVDGLADWCRQQVGLGRLPHTDSV
ncbi:hypothetical protein K491DRAFT_668672 [Lophiostoma macrostomum CBS 122681]|uniref:Zn(2)-C6 fungal-type domain-containing protein n=1 Tax=Lophiostoma macrostomum CBS 122681 TaxID=1314788 RepID=A0A6A6SPG0_9PLEO|nr:hypothetical protein K491DRAFT_668672 [Lophiostoma macrostomum CBS 122681]